VKKNVHDNVIYVSNGYDTEKQYGRQLHLAEMQFITADPWGENCNSVDITFKNRHMPNFMPAKLTRIDDGEYVIDSAERVQGIAPGQFGVIYTPDRRICLGSGIITGRSVVL
jgi:tRNA-specific 2-thiouridylase